MIPNFDVLLPLKTLRDHANHNMPVSAATTENGDIIVISRFCDNVWDFYPYIPQDNIKSAHKQINWNIILIGKDLLTSPKYSRLLSSAKDFIWSLYASPVEGRKRPTMLTIIGKFDLLQPLLRWMVATGMEQFEQISNQAINYVPTAGMSKKSGKKVSSSTLQCRLQILESLYLQRNKIRDGLTVAPWPFESSLSLSGYDRSSAFRKPTTQFIPDKIAHTLAKKAMYYITDRYVVIQLAVTAVTAAEHANQGAHSHTIIKAKTAAARDNGFKGIYDLNTELRHTRTACYIIIDMFSGIRDSEMMSIEENCISRNMSSDLSTELTWLHGTIYKTGMRSKKWIVPEIVAQAVKVLTAISAGIRDELALEICTLEKSILAGAHPEKIKSLSKNLHRAKCQQKKLFLVRSPKYFNEIAVLSGHSLNMHLKSFCEEHGISESPGHPYPLHAHQFRRTYARFVARAELGDLIQLREHFGHASLDMTTYYADGATDDFSPDTELLQMVSEEKNNRQTEVLTSYIIDEAPLANGLHWLSKWRTAVRTAKNKEEIIAKFSGTITLNGTGHSWCAGNAKGMGCGGLCVFEAQQCVDCHYGIIGPEHRAVWTGIRQQQMDVLELNDTGPGGKQRSLDILEMAEKVLSRLDGRSET